MKKTLLVSLTVLFLICSTLIGFADTVSEPSLTVADITNDIIRLSGDVDDNEYVTVIILNPGKSESDIDFADTAKMAETVQYIGTQWVNDGEYVFDVPIRGEEGGTFTVIITAGDEKYVDESGKPFTFDYYYYEEKTSIIEDINDEDDTEKFESLVSEACVLYSYGNDPLYKNGNIEEIAEIVASLKGDGDFEIDPVSFNVTLREALLVAAFNSGMEDVLVKNGLLQYTGEGYLNIADSEAYVDYCNDLNEDGIEKLNNDIIKDKTVYKTIGDINKELRKLVAYYGVVENVKSGYGHIESYFDNEYYIDIYEDCGFEFDELKDDNEVSVYKNLIKSKSSTSDLDDLKNLYNKLVDQSNNPKKSSSGSSGSGSYVPSGTTAPEYITDVKPAVYFVDIESYEWVKDDIIALADKGIVSGVGNNNFAPGANVTRAEFLKMLMSALELTDGSTDVAFVDVTADWMKPYVAAAVKNGITSGVSATEFAPDANITREQSAKFICKALAAKGVELTTDANAFADDSEISEWARDSVNSLKKAGLITGYSDGTVKPANTLTRAEAVKLIVNILTYIQQ